MSKGTQAQLVVTGRLGRDPEKKEGNGYTFARFSVGVTLGFGQREKTYWIDCTVWGEKNADRACDFLRKGSRVFVVGEVGLNTWTNQRGEDQTSMTCNVSTWEPLDSKADRERMEASSGGSSSGGGANREDRQNRADREQRSTGAKSGGWGTGDFADDLDDDVPF